MSMVFSPIFSIPIRHWNGMTVSDNRPCADRSDAKMHEFRPQQIDSIPNQQFCWSNPCFARDVNISKRTFSFGNRSIALDWTSLRELITFGGFTTFHGIPSQAYGSIVPMLVWDFVLPSPIVYSLHVEGIVSNS